jgi:anti-sigma factor RsiW
MNCEHCQELLHARDTAGAASALSPEAAAGVAAHLQTCADCSAVSASLRALGTLLDAELTPSSGLRRQVLARLEQEAPTRSFAALFAQLWAARPIGAFSYSLALVLVGMFSGQLLPADTAAVPAEYQLCPVPDGPPRTTL